MFDFDWKIYTALAFVLLLMAMPIFHRKLYGQIAAKDASELLQSDHEYRLIDLRPEKDFLISHIKQAINIPCNNTAQCKQQIFELVSNADVEQSTVLICDTDLISTKLVKKLNDMGCKDISILKGGFNYWKRKQLPQITEVADS